VKHTPWPEVIESTIESELKAGWLKQFSKSKQREYWFNTETGESVWVCPT
jgi:hypothetical protein